MRSKSARSRIQTSRKWRPKLLCDHEILEESMESVIGVGGRRGLRGGRVYAGARPRPSFRGPRAGALLRALCCRPIRRLAALEGPADRPPGGVVDAPGRPADDGLGVHPPRGIRGIARVGVADPGRLPRSDASGGRPAVPRAAGGLGVPARGRLLHQPALPDRLRLARHRLDLRPPRRRPPPRARGPGAGSIARWLRWSGWPRCSPGSSRWPPSPTSIPGNPTAGPATSTALA